LQASFAPQELNRIAGVDKICDFVKVGYKIRYLFISNSISLKKKKKKGAMGATLYFEMFFIFIFIFLISFSCKYFILISNETWKQTFYDTTKGLILVLDDVDTPRSVRI
jgi:hypothetical protein